MLTNNSIPSYNRPVSGVGARRIRVKNNSLSVTVDTELCKKIGKVAGVVFSAVLCVNMLFGVYKGHLTSMVSMVEQQRHELMDRNIGLRAQRAAMLNPNAIADLAGKTLSLQKPESRQYLVYNTAENRFEKL